MFVYLLCFLFASFPARTAALESATEATGNILDNARGWMQKFGSHVANDIGYTHFAKLIPRAQLDLERVRFEGPDQQKPCIEKTTCALFSSLRCATCFAMALNANINEGVFSQALALCHDAEVYQIFVATDSYNKGKTPTKNARLLHTTAQKLFEQPPEILQNHGGVLRTYPWVLKTIKNHQEQPFLKSFSWLQDWAMSRDSLSDFLKNDLRKTSGDYVLALRDLCKRHPYFLHHLEASDVAKHAFILAPAICLSQHFCLFESTIKESLPFDPAKKPLLDIICNMRSVYIKSLQPSYSTCQNLEEIYHIMCSIIVDGVWTFFASLGAHITQDQWQECVVMLRQNFFVSAAFQQGYNWLPDVFKEHQSLQGAPCEETKADYYTRVHAVRIYEKAQEITKDICQLLDKHCSTCERNNCEDLQKHTLSYEDENVGKGLAKRNMDLMEIFRQRCVILWTLSKEDPPSPDWHPLYKSCTPAEKRALCRHAQKKLKNGAHKDLLTPMPFPEDPKDLTRLDSMFKGN